MKRGDNASQFQHGSPTTQELNDLHTYIGNDGVLRSLPSHTVSATPEISRLILEIKLSLGSHSC